MGLQFQTGAGLSALSGIQAAVSKKDAAQQELQAYERNLESAVKSLNSEIEVLQSMVDPAQEILVGTTELVDSYLRQYQIGRKNWLDVLNALREKAQALYGLADVKYNLLQSQTKLLILSGQLQANNTSVIHE